jgi:hypothetical protein
MHCSNLAPITMHCFLILLFPLCSNSSRLSSTSRIAIISKDDTFDTYSIPWRVETRWLATKSLGNIRSGAKNSRIGNTLSGKIFENVFEHLGVVTTPLRCLQMIFINMNLDLGGVEIGGFLKNGIVYKCSPNQLLPCNHITRYGMGLVLKFICFSAGSLVLYKGL